MRRPQCAESRGNLTVTSGEWVSLSGAQSPLSVSWKNEVAKVL